MFTEEKQKYGELASARSSKIITSNPALYADSPESRHVEHFEYLGHDVQQGTGSVQYSSQATYYRDSKNDSANASYVPYNRDKENDLAYEMVNDLRSERAVVYGRSVDSSQYPSQPYKSDPEPEQLVTTPRMYASTLRFEPANAPTWENDYTKLMFCRGLMY